MKRSIVLPVLLLCCMIPFTGCNKKTSKVTAMPQESVKPPDTAKVVVPPPAPVDTSDSVSYKPAVLDTSLATLVAANLKTVYFEYNSSALNQESTDLLAKASSFLMSHASMRILVEGHCDERGSAEYNMGLGEQRAKAVKSYLVNLGIPASRMETTSWGKEHLLVTGCTDDPCHSQNRRGEFKVLTK